MGTLVNETKPAGKYEVKFDGIGLASGIYLYKLQVTNPDGSGAGSGEVFSSVKKLVLLK